MREERLRLYVRDQLAATDQSRVASARCSAGGKPSGYSSRPLRSRPWSGWPARRRRASSSPARAWPHPTNGTSKAAQNLADDRADIAQMTSLAPFLIQPGPKPSLPPKSWAAWGAA